MRFILLLAACNDPALLPEDAAPPPAQALQLNAPAAGRIGADLPMLLLGAGPNEQVSLLLGTGISDDPCASVVRGVCTPLTGVSGFAASARANVFGDVFFTVPVPPTTPLDHLGYFQAVAFRGPGGSVVSNVERVRAGDGSARVRVVHASSDAPTVDVYANGSLLVPHLDYLDATPFVAVPPGIYTIDLRAAGASPNSRPVHTSQIALDPDVDTTAIASGFLQSTRASDRLRVLPVVEDLASPTPGFYSARVVHAGADAPPVLLDVGADGTAEVGPLPRFANTGGGGIPLPANTSLQIATVAAVGSAPFTLPPFQTDDDLLVIATGRIASRPNAPDAFGLLALDQHGVVGFVRRNPQVYVLHASPDAPAVDLQTGGLPLVDDLAFRELSAPITVPPGSYLLDVLDSNGTQYVTSVVTPELAPGGRYLAVATGFLSSTPEFQVVYFEDNTIIDPNAATLQVIHAVPDAPPVAAGVLAPGFVDLTGPLTFGFSATSSGVQVSPGDYDVAIALPDGQVLFQFPGLELFARDRYFLAATGSLAAGTFGITTIDVTTSPWSAVTVYPAR